MGCSIASLCPLLVFLLVASTFGHELGSGAQALDIPLIDSFTTKYCGSCEAIIGDLYSALPGGNATWEVIEQAADEICGLLPKAPLRIACKALVAELVEIGESLDLSVQKSYSPYMLCTMLSLCSTNCCLMPYSPEQVHLAYTGDPTELVFSWTTGDETPNPMVQLGSSPDFLDTNISATAATYHKGGWQGTLYTAKATGLKSNTEYFYRVGDPEFGWTVINFSTVTAPPVSNDGTGAHAILAIGDMGASDVSDATITRMMPWAYNSSASFLLHAGDISYANGYQPTWDDYMRKVEPLASRVPYMVAPGNHEIFYNFTSYKMRFPMPGNESKSDTNMFYSFDYGNVHYVAFNFEQEFGFSFDTQPGGVQYEWLENDLKAASANRKAVPWIVLFGHRPFYCSTFDDSGTTVNCVKHASDYRKSLEAMLNKYGVDLVIQAHVHNYERTYPVANEQVTSTSYNSPSAPVYVVSGAAGQKEGLDNDFFDPVPAWSAVRVSQYGFGIMSVSGSSKLEWKFVSSYTGEVLDSFTISK